MDRTGLYTMSVAADLMDLHPSTLRLWERKGLLTPSRTEGENRLYSDANLARMRRMSRSPTNGSTWPASHASSNSRTFSPPSAAHAPHRSTMRTNTRRHRSTQTGDAPAKPVEP